MVFDLEFCKILDDLIPQYSEDKHAIQIKVQELKLGSSINWDNVRAILKQLYQLSLPAEFGLDDYGVVGSFLNNFEKVIFTFLHLFESHKCSDKSIIADILELLCLIRHNSNSVTDYDIIKWIIIRLNEMCADGQIPMSTFEKSLVFSYKDIPSIVPQISEPKSMPFEWVKNLAVTGQMDLLKVIISHGATLIVPRQSTFTGIILEIFQMWLIFKQDFTRMGVDNVLYTLKERSILYKLEYEKHHSIKRLYLVNTFLDLFLKYDLLNVDLFLQCARILIYSTPEPLITSKEIKTLFSILCNGIVSNNEVQRFLEEFESNFPESREPSTPRTLIHLSRFQVRESLRTAGSFPYGVESLGLPQKIQDFIRFKDIL